MKYEATVSEYKRALQSMRLSANDLKMIHVHYRKPNHSITCLGMGRKMGWEGKSANAHYGRFAKRLCAVMKRKPPVPEGETEPFYVAIMLDFDTDDDDRVLWVMSDNFVAALKATRIV